MRENRKIELRSFCTCGKSRNHFHLPKDILLGKVEVGRHASYVRGKNTECCKPKKYQHHLSRNSKLCVTCRSQRENGRKVCGKEARFAERNSQSITKGSLKFLKLQECDFSQLPLVIHGGEA